MIVLLQNLSHSNLRDSLINNIKIYFAVALKLAAAFKF